MAEAKKEIAVKKTNSRQTKEPQSNSSPSKGVEHTLEDFFERHFFAPRPNLSELTGLSSSMTQGMDRMLEDFFERHFFAPSLTARPKFTKLANISSSVDMFEDGDELVIKAEMPGLKKEDINIDFSGDVITISGEKKEEEQTRIKDFYKFERSFGSFSRKIRLPLEVQIDKTHASFKDGVLEIRMPKSEAVKQKARKISIK